jgi:hypothetical protein
MMPRFSPRAFENCKKLKRLHLQYNFEFTAKDPDDIHDADLLRCIEAAVLCFGSSSLQSLTLEVSIESSPFCKGNVAVIISLWVLKKEIVIGHTIGSFQDYLTFALISNRISCAKLYCLAVHHC